MPIKFSPSTRKFVRGQKRKTFEFDHDYIKLKPTEELIKYINEGYKPKVKRKCRVELDRRRVLLEKKIKIASNE